MVVDNDMEVECPKKMRVFFWLSVEEKILTWDVGFRCGWNGLSQCTVCRLGCEMEIHL
jgi:hypothetical protein